MEQYNKKIYTIRQSIFRGEWQQGMDNTIGLLGELLQDQTLDATLLQRYAQKLMQAMQCKDYLLLADIVYFDLPPLWESSTELVDAYGKEECGNESLFGKFTISKNERG